MSAQRFGGRVVVVTAAGSGIGAATARRLADEGATVIATDLHAPSGSGLLPLDVSSAADWERVRDLALEQHGRIDVLHSNAAHDLVKPTHETSEDEWNAQLAVSLTGAWLGFRTCLDALRQARGNVVFTSSVHALFGLPAHPAYAAAKGGLCALARQLAVEYGPEIRVNTVVPGPILTPAWDGVSQTDRQRSAAATVAGRLGRPEEAAAAVAFLASDDASFITGSAIVVDGGWSIVKDSV